MAEEIEDKETSPLGAPAAAFGAKEEKRNEPHDYVDHNGWCAVCGRSEGWKAHSEKEAAEPRVEVPAIAPVDAADAEPSDDSDHTSPPDEETI